MRHAHVTLLSSPTWLFSHQLFNFFSPPLAFHLHLLLLHLLENHQSRQNIQVILKSETFQLKTIHSRPLSLFQVTSRDTKKACKKSGKTWLLDHFCPKKQQQNNGWSNSVVGLTKATKAISTHLLSLYGNVNSLIERSIQKKIICLLLINRMTWRWFVHCRIE